MSKHRQRIDAEFQQGLNLHAAGRMAEADRVYRSILAVEPGHADSLHMLGVLALQTDQPAAALAWLDQAVNAAPSAALIHAHRANALLALGRAAEAETACRVGLGYRGDCVEAWRTLAQALSEMRQYADAVEACERVRSLDPQAPQAHNELGLALGRANRQADAVATFQRALRLYPDDDVIRGNLANAFKEAGRPREAETVYRAMLARAPDDVVTRFNMGIVLLLAERFQEGWAEWECRFQADSALIWDDARPFWRGEPLAGRTLLVHGEQGLGDMIQFARYLPLLPRDGQVVLRVQAPLVRLLSGIAGVDRLVALDDPVPEATVRCGAMSLPFLLGLPRPEDCPTPIPYLAPDPGMAAQWRDRLAALPGLKVGLAWAGNPDPARMGWRRSVPVERLAGLGDVPNVSLISLQKGIQVTGPLADRVVDWTSDLGDLADTAALVAGLDLVISVDTSVAHLAGALGRPVWALIRADPCWRWGLGREDSAWYPTLRQFRQDVAGSWEAPIARVCEALRRLG